MNIYEILIMLIAEMHNAFMRIFKKQNLSSINYCIHLLSVYWYLCLFANVTVTLQKLSKQFEKMGEKTQIHVKL